MKLFDSILNTGENHNDLAEEWRALAVDSATLNLHNATLAFSGEAAVNQPGLPPMLGRLASNTEQLPEQLISEAAMPPQLTQVSNEHAQVPFFPAQGSDLVMGSTVQAANEVVTTPLYYEDMT